MTIGVGARIAYALQTFFTLLFSGTIPVQVLEAVGPSRPGAPAAPAREGGTVDPSRKPPAAPADAGDRAVQLLALFQRDGRLVDFLREDLGSYTDAQIGAAVRDVHASCRQVLERYLPVEPILADAEGEPTVIAAPVDPASVKLVGHVGTHASYRGTVRHRGWRVTSIALPPLATADARLVVAAAEVEVG